MLVFLCQVSLSESLSRDNRLSCRQSGLAYPFNANNKSFLAKKSWFETQYKFTYVQQQCNYNFEENNGLLSDSDVTNSAGIKVLDLFWIVFVKLSDIFGFSSFTPS